MLGNIGESPPDSSVSATVSLVGEGTRTYFTLTIPGETLTITPHFPKYLK